MPGKKQRKDPCSISVLLYDVIENTDLDKVSSEGSQAYKNTLALLDQDSFTARERDAAFKKLRETGWKPRVVSIRDNEKNICRNKKNVLSQNKSVLYRHYNGNRKTRYMILLI